MDKIGGRTIKAMQDLSAELLNDHAKKINEAFMKSDDGSVKVSISLDVSESEKRANYIDVDATISFTTEKVKAKITKSVSDTQPLFDAIDKLTSKKGSGIESVTLSSGDKSVTLEAK